jgi:hypothetical protein
LASPGSGEEVALFAPLTKTDLALHSGDEVACPTSIVGDLRVVLKHSFVVEDSSGNTFVVEDLSFVVLKHSFVVEDLSDNTFVVEDLCAEPNSSPVEDLSW